MTTPPLPPDDPAAPEPPESSADQEHSMPDQTAAEHLALDDLADFAVGELSAEAATEVEAHLASCRTCSAVFAELRSDLDLVSSELGEPGPGGVAPAPMMPVTVAARLDRALAAEADARQTGGTGTGGTGTGGVGTGSDGAGRAGTGSDGAGGAGATVTPLRRATPLKAPATATYVKQTGLVRMMAAAAVAAAVVGFGGYVVSASAGLNEPSALSPTQVHPDALASQAKTLAESRDLDPHLFSAAWRCARKVTAGRITGITPVYVDGAHNYLVYTRSGGTTYATLVTGCNDGAPAAGRRVKLSE
jgi:anti-sigma factor RsiW